MCGKQFSWNVERENTERATLFSMKFSEDPVKACIDILCNGIMLNENTTFHEDEGSGGEEDHIGNAQLAKAWKNRNYSIVSRAMIVWWKNKFPYCPSQACALQLADNLSDGAREACTIWSTYHSKEIDKCKRDNLFSVKSIFPSLYIDSDRPLAAYDIVSVGSSNANTSKSHHAKDFRLVASARYWIEENRVRYYEEIEQREKRLASNFLMLYGNKSPLNINPSISSFQYPYEFSSILSNSSLTFTNNNTTVKRVGSVSCYPACFAELPSTRSMMTIQTECLELKTNW